MSPTQLKYSILRLINYAHADRDRFDRSVSYITNPKKTNAEMICSQYFIKDNPSQSLETMEKHWLNAEMSGRLFKHGIIAFGSSEISPEKALELVKATMEYYTGFPYLAALHTDVPHRLHAHFLLGMRNVKTGKKFSQSPSDLRAFRKHYHDLALKYDLLGLKDCCSNEEHTSSAISLNAHIPDTIPKAGWHDSKEDYWSAANEIQMYGNPQNSGYPFTQTLSVPMQHEIQNSQEIMPKRLDIVNDVFRSAQSDFNFYFFQGFKGGLEG